MSKKAQKSNQNINEVQKLKFKKEIHDTAKNVTEDCDR